MSAPLSREELHARLVEEEENARDPRAVPFTFLGRENGMDGYSFTIHAPSVFALRPLVTMVTMALEAHCYPHEGTSLDYAASTATFHVGPGAALHRGVRQFIDFMHPRALLTGFSLDVLSDMRLVAAAAVEDPERFAEVDASICDALRSRATEWWPDSCMPCMEPLFEGRDRAATRAKAKASLAAVRDRAARGAVWSALRGGV